MTRDEAAKIVLGRIENPTPIDPDETKSVWKQLLDNLRFRFKAGKKEQAASAETHCKF